MLDNTAYCLRISPCLPFFWTSPSSVRISSTPSWLGIDLIFRFCIVINDLHPRPKSPTRERALVSAHQKARGPLISRPSRIFLEKILEAPLHAHTFLSVDGGTRRNPWQSLDLSTRKPRSTASWRGRSWQTLSRPDAAMSQE